MEEIFFTVEVDEESSNKKEKKNNNNPEFLMRKKHLKALKGIVAAEKMKQNEIISESPTKVLYLANCGHGTGIKQETVEPIFKEVNGFIKLMAEKCKNFLLVKFDSEEAAQEAIKRFNYTNSEILGRPIFLFYAKGYTENDSLTVNDIPGLILIENFISPEEEEKIAKAIEEDKSEWHQLSRRKVKHWGYNFNYKEFTFDKNKIGPLPEFCDNVVDKIKGLNVVSHTPDQMTINMYEPGAGIPSHIETHSAFEDGLVSLSLLAQTMMEFKHPDGHKVEVLLQPRSLLILTKESRYLWSHGISARKTDVVDETIVSRDTRISLTFRKVRVGNCDCPYKAQCDSWLTTYKGSKVHNTVIEDSYVKDVYDSIAEHFSDTRYKPWPKIENFLNEQQAGSLVCDVGCGNGKYLGVNPAIFKIGNDQSIKLIEIAKERGHEVSVCNNLHLPFRSNCFDVVMSIAVIHHFSTELHRVIAIEELTRIARPGGKILIYVWAMEQEGRKFGQQDVLVPWHMEKEKYGEKEIEPETEITKREKTFQVYQRYYHVFRKGELTNLITKIPSLELLSEDYDHANWVILARKK